MEISLKSLALHGDKSKLKAKKLLSIFCLTIFVGSAFYFSSQPASISKLQSGHILSLLHDLGFESLTMHMVRKLAHITLFAGLAGALALVLSYNVKGLKLWASSFIIATALGGLNEVHQMFVPGRGPQVIDVMINGSGALIGAGLTTLVIYRHVHTQE